MQMKPKKFQKAGLCSSIYLSMRSIFYFRQSFLAALTFFPESTADLFWGGSFRSVLAVNNLRDEKMRQINHLVQKGK